jgi:hypothetical protein
MPWACTQGRRPVSFVLVYIPLRGEPTINENKTNKQKHLNRRVRAESDRFQNTWGSFEGFGEALMAKMRQLNGYAYWELFKAGLGEEIFT